MAPSGNNGRAILPDCLFPDARALNANDIVASVANIEAQYVLTWQREFELLAGRQVQQKQLIIAVRILCEERKTTRIREPLDTGDNRAVFVGGLAYASKWPRRVCVFGRPEEFGHVLCTIDTKSRFRSVEVKTPTLGVNDKVPLIRRECDGLGLRRVSVAEARELNIVFHGKVSLSARTRSGYQVQPDRKEEAERLSSAGKKLPAIQSAA